MKNGLSGVGVRILVGWGNQKMADFVEISNKDRAIASKIDG
jgi:hypothetical protein